MAQSVLLTSVPRSGSSWVGWVLGRAEGVSYEREPITQGLLSVDLDPFSVCRSHLELGWIWKPETVISDRFPESPERDVLASIEGTSPSFWMWHGAYQAAVAKAVRAMCGDQLITVRYEDLVAKPKREFRRLAKRANLSWVGGVPRPEARATASPFSLVRDSANRGWSAGVDAQQIDECRSGWELIDGAPDIVW